MKKQPPLRMAALATLVVAAGLQLSTNTANATLLAYDGFDYTPVGATINGLNGGSGFLSAYSSATTVVLTNGLSYSGLAACGANAAKFNAASIVITGRNWGDTNAVLSSGTTWYSFLAYPQHPYQGTFVPFRNLLSEGGAPLGQNGYGLRADRVVTSPGVTNILFKAWDPAQSSGAKQFTNTYDSTYFILGRLVVNASGNAVSNTIWVYKSGVDSIPVAEPLVADGSTFTSSWSGSQTNARPILAGRAFGGSQGGAYDEVRIGTAFGDVVPSACVLPPVFTITPPTGVENQTLTMSWANIPAGFTSVTLNPGALDVTGSTDGGGNGSTPVQAPATSTQYILTYVVGGTPTSLTNQFTAVAPFFTITPSTDHEPDPIVFNWRIPVGSTSVDISPDVGPQADPDGTGAGSANWLAPGSNTTYVLSYIYNANPYSLTQQFTLAAPFFTVPSPAVEYGSLPITWRIPLGFSSVFLQSGPAGGPYTNIDVTANTAFTTGAGSINLIAGLGQTNFTLFYTNAGIGYLLTTNILTFQQIFTNLVASNNIKSVVINGAPMNDGVKAYSDRDHFWTNVPSILQGAQFINFGNDEKNTTNLVVSVTAAKQATFFLLLDNRIGDGVGGTTPLTGTDNPPTLPSTNMAWVLSSGFVDTGLDIGLEEVGNPNPGVDNSYSVYFRQVNIGESYTFFAQADGSTRNMYGVAGVSPQVTPVAFIATLTSITNGNSTTLQWTVPVGSDVSIDNGIGNVSNITDVVFGTGSTNIVPPLGTNVYTLTYNPPGPSTPPVSLAPVTVVVVPAPVTIPTTPTNLTFSATGGQVTLSWPAEYLGWSLQKQTNALGVGLSTNWQTIVGSELVTSTNLPVNEAAATFFRMFYLAP